MKQHTINTVTRHVRFMVLAAGCAATGLGVMVPAAQAGEVSDITPERTAELVRMVRQDCGSCHGMRLTGGLGPSLTRQALQEKDVASMAATIYHGRPGTAMPGWKAMINAREAEWIAERLLQGFPEERGRSNR